MKKNRQMRQFKALVIKHIHSPQIVRGGLFQDRLDALRVWESIPRFAIREYEMVDVLVTIKPTPKKKKKS